MEHEQDTVLQLQEVIEQLRNVFPSEPGEFVYGCTDRSSCGTPRFIDGLFALPSPTGEGEMERRANMNCCGSIAGGGDREIKWQTGRVR